MLDPRRLRVLRAVARHGSFAAAAAALDYTPAAVSAQIATLEREIGATLIARGPRGARGLTEMGELVLGHAETVLAGLERAEADIEARMAAQGRRLRIAAFPAALPGLIPAAIVALRRAQPAAEVMVVESSPDETFERVRSGEVDLGLVHSRDGGPDPAGRDLESVALRDDPVLLALPAGHRLAQARLTVEALLGEPWIAPRTGGPHHAFHTGPFADAHVVAETDQMAAVLGLVAAGLGLGFVTTLALPAPPGVVVRGTSVGGVGLAAVVRPAPRAPLVQAGIAALRAGADTLLAGVEAPVDAGP